MDYSLLISNFTASHGHHGWPRQRLLHECLRAAIRDGTLAPGTRLVATRALAAELGVARNTVLYAYEQLTSEGYVSTDRSGTIVAAVAPARQHQASVVVPYKGLSLRAQNLRHSTASAAAGTPFVPGVPDLPSFPIGLWRRLLERAWRSLPTEKLNYGDSCGEAVLREAIADYLRASRGVVCEPAQVFITDGSQSSLDLCGRACADAGETLWMENPGYGGAMAAFRAASVRLEGIDVDVFLVDADRLFHIKFGVEHDHCGHQFGEGSDRHHGRRILFKQDLASLILNDQHGLRAKRHGKSGGGDRHQQG